MPEDNRPLWAKTIQKRATDQYIGSDTRAREHKLAADRWTSIHLTLGSVATLFAGIAGATILLSFDDDARTIVAGILSLLASAAAGIDTVLGSRTVAEGHKLGYDGFTSLRTQWLELSDQAERVESGYGPEDEQRLASLHTELLAKRDALSEKVPPPPEWARKKVARAKR